MSAAINSRYTEANPGFLTLSFASLSPWFSGGEPRRDPVLVAFADGIEPGPQSIETDGHEPGVR